MISILIAVLLTLGAFIAGVVLASVIASASRAEACADCPGEQAWQFVRQTLNAAGVPHVTPALASQLALTGFRALPSRPPEGYGLPPTTTDDSLR